MEKTNTHKTNEVFSDAAKMTNKLFSDSCSVMTDIYDKQLRSTLGFYNSLFDSLSGNVKENSSNYIPSFFNGSEILNFMSRSFNPFSFQGGWMNFFQGQFEEIQKHMTEFNNRLFTMFLDEFKNRQENRKEFNKLIEEEWKAVQNITDSLLETYSKQMNQSLSFNKKLRNEINDQFTRAVEQNKKYWADIQKEEKEEETTTEPDHKNGNGQAKKHYKAEFSHSKM